MSGSPVRSVAGHRTDACDGFPGLRRMGLMEECTSVEGLRPVEGIRPVEGLRRSMGIPWGSLCAGVATTPWVGGRMGRAPAGMVHRPAPDPSWAVADDGAQMGDNGLAPASGYERGVRVDA